MSVAEPDPELYAVDAVRRVLVVDDTEGIHHDIRRILDPASVASRLTELESEMGWGELEQPVETARFVVDSATQGKQAMEMVQQGLSSGRRYMLAFVDMRMPPGWDGLETIARLQEADPQIQVVLCTAYSDFPARGSVPNPGRSDSLVLLKKPFEIMEVYQLAWALTEKWRMTRESELQRRMLEDLLAIRTDSLRAARDELLSFTEELATARRNAAAAEHLREDFLHELSREMRNPLGGVVGMTNLLMETKLDKKQSEYVEVVSRSADLLLNRLNNVLDRANLECDELELEERVFDLIEVVEACVENGMRRAARKGVELAMKIDPRVPRELLGDAQRLRQVLGVLIDNAIKYTYNGHVLVSMSIEQDLDHPLQIIVGDSGIGMEQAFASRVFDAEIDDQGLPTGSVGLPLASRLIEKMGGHLAVASQEGLGSVFSIHLPSPEDAPTAEQVLPTGRLRGADVLVVSPRAIVRRILHDLFGSWQMHVAMALSLEDCFEVIQESIEDGELFQLVVVDQHESTTDGPELANAMTDPHRIGGIPTLVLGDPTRALSLDEVQEAGFAGYMMKPIRPHRLALGLDRILEGVEQGAPVSALTERELDLPGPLSRRPWREPRPTWARVLVADDHEVSQKVASSMLEQLGCAVDVAHDGRQVMSLVQRNDYDLILMDCVMPFMDGFQTAEQIRSFESQTEDGNLRVPILAMTSGATPEARERSSAAGMDGVLVKPVRLLDLQEQLELWTGN